MGDFQVGQRWSSRAIKNLGNYRGWLEFEVRIAAYEDVTVRLGTFKAYRMKSQFNRQSGTPATHTLWFSPKIGMVKFIREARLSNGQGHGYMDELIARNGA